MPVSGHPIPRPQRQRPDTMGCAVEASPKRLRHHLRRPDADEGQLIMKPPLTPLIGQTLRACVVSRLLAGIVASATRPRLTFSRISSAVAVHTNGLGSLLLAWRYASIAAIRSGTDLKTPRRMAFSVSSRNQRSAMFSHELDVGMKCRWNRGCLSSQATTLSWVWVP